MHSTVLFFSDVGHWTIRFSGYTKIIVISIVMFSPLLLLGGSSRSSTTWFWGKDCIGILWHFCKTCCIYEYTRRGWVEAERYSYRTVDPLTLLQIPQKRGKVHSQDASASSQVVVYLHLGQTGLFMLTLTQIYLLPSAGRGSCLLKCWYILR